MAVLKPSSELEAMIRKESNEDVQTSESYLQIIKEWMLQQPHLPDTWDDNMLMNFLRGSKFSLEKCKNKLDRYFTVRTTIPEFFTNRTFNNEKLLLESTLTECIPVPKLTEKGYSVTIFRLTTKNFGCAYEALKLCFMILDMRLKEETFGNSGHVFILDAEHLTLAHLTIITPTFLKKLVVSIFDAYPLRFKEIHVVNVAPVFLTIFTIIKPLLKPKIIDRFHFHNNADKTSNNNYESLYKHVPKSLLPVEYGGYGTSKKIITDQWIQKLRDNEAWFVEQEAFKSDETKRVKLINHAELFGVEGSFKKLSID